MLELSVRLTGTGRAEPSLVVGNREEGWNNRGGKLGRLSKAELSGSILSNACGFVRHQMEAGWRVRGDGNRSPKDCERAILSCYSFLLLFRSGGVTNSSTLLLDHANKLPLSLRAVSAISVPSWGPSCPTFP